MRMEWNLKISLYGTKVPKILHKNCGIASNMLGCSSPVAVGSYNQYDFRRKLPNVILERWSVQNFI